VTIDVPYIPPLDVFFLSMWIRVNMSRDEDATIFELLDSESRTVLKLKRLGKNLEFFFNCHDSSLKL
jgi:hypothetical protein